MFMSTAVRISEKLVREAKIKSKIENRSLTGQIEFWAKIGKMAEENPYLGYPKKYPEVLTYDSGLPYHPGAIKYWKEVRAWNR